MHSLIVTAHPSASGFTHRAAQAYAEALTKKGHTSLLMNLYDPTWKQDFLFFASQEERMSRNKELSAIQKEIARADELVFVFPIWWHDVPAIMKNFLDLHFTAGFAFAFTPHGLKGLLTGKTVRYISTAGGPAWVYTYRMFPYATSFRRSLRECGIKQTSVTIFGNRRGADPTREARWLQDIARLAA